MGDISDQIHGFGFGIGQRFQPQVQDGDPHHQSNRWNLRSLVSFFRKQQWQHHPQPLREPKAPRLEHLLPVPKEPPSTTLLGPVQRRARARIPPLPRPVREDQGSQPPLPVLRSSQPPRAVSLPAPPGVGQPRRPHRPPPRRLRGKRRPPGDQPLRCTGREDLPARRAWFSGEGEGCELWEEKEEAEAEAHSRSYLATLEEKKRSFASNVSPQVSNMNRSYILCCLCFCLRFVFCMLIFIIGLVNRVVDVLCCFFAILRCFCLFEDVLRVRPLDCWDDALEIVLLASWVGGS